MDLKIKLYPNGKTDNITAWNWELLSEGKRIAGGKEPATQEVAFVSARAALSREQSKDH